MKGSVYILKGVSGRFYIGSTTDIERRFKQHLQGHTQTTRRMQNPTICLVQEYETLRDARSIEKKLKNLKRKDYIEKIIADGYIKISPRRSTDRT